MLEVVYRRRAQLWLAAVTVALLALGATIWSVSLSQSGATSLAATSPSIGIALNRSVPTSIADLPLESQSGRDLTLEQFKGKAVFLVPFLTSCQEECPLTTAVLLQMQQVIDRSALRNGVIIVEATVDPGATTPRDSRPSRLTGSTWPLLTGSPGAIASLSHCFGIWYQKAPEGLPPGINWQDHRPYTYDVNHPDGAS